MYCFYYLGKTFGLFRLNIPKHTYKQIYFHQDDLKSLRNLSPPTPKDKEFQVVVTTNDALK